MKKALFLPLALLIFLACNMTAQKPSIHGEGDVVKQEITLPAIDGIMLGFSGEVVLTPGSPQKIVIEGQQNIIDNIKREVKDGTWRIVYDKNVRDAKEVTVYITIPTIEDVGLSGSGSIKGTGKFTGLNDLDISISGSGSISLDFDANQTDLSISGSGDIDLSGSTQAFDISISGSGDVEADQLQASDCEIHISGSGDAKVNVNGDLETQISGSGDVYYKGNASVQARISGSGSVSKL